MINIPDHTKTVTVISTLIPRHPGRTRRTYWFYLTRLPNVQRVRPCGRWKFKFTQIAGTCIRTWKKSSLGVKGLMEESIQLIQAANTIEKYKGRKNGRIRFDTPIRFHSTFCYIAFANSTVNDTSRLT